MNYYDLKLMTKEELIKSIKQLGEAYVPKWHFNTSEPDLGSALALIFADMYGELIDRAKKLPDKHHVDFLNLLEPIQRSACGAKGYVVFELSEGNTAGIGLDTGKQLIGIDDQGDNLVFETTEDLWLSPAKLQAIYMVSSARDAISPIFDADMGVALTPFFMPMVEMPLNLQEHQLEIKAEGTLLLKTAAALDILLEDFQSMVRRDQLLNLLSRGEFSAWSYFKDDQWHEFTEVFLIDGGLRLSVKGPLKLEAERIRLTLKSPLRLECDAFWLKPVANPVMADALYNNDIQLSPSECLMFNAQFYAYDVCYIASEEVFSKAGAQVTMNLDYIMLGAETPFEVPEPQVKWKNVLRKSDIPEVKVKPIHISDLSLEYWNGIGWLNLPFKSFDRQMFKKPVGEMGHTQIIFDCPLDMKRTTVGAFENYWIRLRIAGVENAYTLSGIYQIPKLKKLSLIYQYLGNGAVPTHMQAREFLEIREVTAEDQPLTLFESYGDLAGEAFYLCFDKPLRHGPLKLLFDLGTVVKDKKPKFSYQLLKRVGEHRKWETLEVLDHTKHLTETGVVSFIGDEAHEKFRCFGKEGYWLRVKMTEVGTLPVLIEGIYLNGASVLQVESKLSYYDNLKSYEYLKTIQLPHELLERLDLWVDEIELSYEELIALGLPFDMIKSDDGQIEHQWVLWQPFEDLSQMSERTRGYLVNLFEGKVSFGDTVNGFLPEGQHSNNVKIDYKLTRGKAGNVSANAITNLGTAIPYVNTLKNPMPTAGGKAPESRQDALRRTSQSLRHQNRALTLSDFNALIMAADYDIAKVKTITGEFIEGIYSPGHVVSAVLTKTLKQDNDYFDGLKAQIYETLGQFLPCTLIPERNFHIVEPTQVVIDVHLKGRIAHMNRYLDVQREVLIAIEAYLDTYRGGPLKQGWQLGELPRYQDLLAVIQKIDGLEEVAYLILNASVREGYHMREVSLETLKDNPFLIIKPGMPTIILSTSQ